jgi:hypothetical protein
MSASSSLRNIEPVPEWWTEAFHDRQGTIRRRVMYQLGRAKAPMMLLQIQQCLTQYFTKEVSYALTTLVRWGNVEIHEHEIRVDGKHATTIRTESFYSLAVAARGVRR